MLVKMHMLAHGLGAGPESHNVVGSWCNLSRNNWRLFRNTRA